MVLNRLNIPATVVHNRGGRVTEVRGTLVSLNESLGTCTVDFGSRGRKVGIPMRDVRIDEGLMDVLKGARDKVKGAINKVVSFTLNLINGYIVPILDGKPDKTLIANPVNAVIAQSNGVKLDEGRVAVYPSGYLKDVLSKAGVSVGDPDYTKEIEDESEIRDLNAVYEYWNAVMEDYSENDLPIKESVKYTRARLIKEYENRYGRRRSRRLNEARFDARAANSELKGRADTSEYATTNKARRNVMTMPKLLSLNAAPGMLNDATVISDPEKLVRQVREDIIAQFKLARKSMFGNMKKVETETPKEGKISDKKAESNNDLGIDTDGFESHFNNINESQEFDKEEEFSWNPNFTGGRASYTPIMIWGAPGVGKTTLISKAVKALRTESSGRYNLNLMVCELATTKPDDLALPQVQKGKEGEVNDEGKTQGETPTERGSLLPSWLPMYEPQNYSGNPKLDKNIYNYNRKLDALYNSNLVWKNNRLTFDFTFGDDERYKGKTALDIVNDEDIDYKDVEKTISDAEIMNGNVLFFDEFSRAEYGSVYDMVMNLCLSGRYGTKICASRTAFVGASNRFEDFGGFNESKYNTKDTAQASRFRHYMFVPTFKSWLSWLKTKLDKYPALKPIYEFVEYAGPLAWYDTAEFRKDSKWFRTKHETMAKRADDWLKAALNTAENGEVAEGAQKALVDYQKKGGADIDATRNLVTHNGRSWENALNNIGQLYDRLECRDDAAYGDGTEDDEFNEYAGMSEEQLDKMRRQRWCQWYFGTKDTPGAWRDIDPKKNSPVTEYFVRYAKGLIEELPDVVKEEALLTYFTTLLEGFGADIQGQYTEWKRDMRYVDAAFAKSVWDTGYPSKTDTIEFGKKLYYDDKQPRKNITLWEANFAPMAKYYTKKMLDDLAKSEAENLSEAAKALSSRMVKNPSEYLSDGQYPDKFQWRRSDMDVMNAMRNIIRFMPQEYIDDLKNTKITMTKESVKKYATKQNYLKFRNQLSLFGLALGGMVFDGKWDILFLNKPEFQLPGNRERQIFEGTPTDEIITILAQSKFAQGLCNVMRFCNDSLLRTPHGILDGNTLNMRMNTLITYAMDELSKHEGIDVDMGDIDNIGQFLGKLMTTGTKDIPAGWNGQKPEELQDYDETTHSWGALYDEGDRDEKQQKEYDNIASQITNPARKDKSGRYGRKYKTEMPSNMAQALAFYPAMFVGGEKTARILSSVDKGRKGKDSIVNDDLEKAGYSKTSVKQ